LQGDRVCAPDPSLTIGYLVVYSAAGTHLELERD
jgi:hypothetical protein